MTLEDGDELAWVRVTNGSDELLVATRHGMAIRFSETDVRPMGRTARGVRAIQLREGDEVVGMSIVRDGGLVLTVSETGYGRLSSPEDYRLQSRGGKGIINYHTGRYGNVAAIKVVDPEDDIILISSDGVIIRIQADSVRLCARPSKGVRVMRLQEGSRVVTLARTAHEEEEETDSLPEDDGSAGENVEPGETQVFGGAEEGENAHEDGEDAQTTENTED